MVAYNAGRHLATAVASIQSQTFADWELVLIDNHSTDGSIEALVAESNDPRLRITRLPENRGHPGGLRAGLGLCRGEGIALMDADDVSHPERLAAQSEFLRVHPETGLVGSLAERIDPAGRTLGPVFSLVRDEDIRVYAPYDMPFLLATAFGRRQFFERIGFREGFSWAHDLDFLLRAIEVAPVACLPRVLYGYRKHDTSVSGSRRYLQVASASFARLAAARRRCGRPERADELRAEETAWLRTEPAEAETYACFARRFAAEGHFAMAIMYTRRAFVPPNRIRMLALAAKALVCGAARDPRGFGFLLKLSLVGPAQALGVRSKVALPSRRRRPFVSLRHAPPS
jgi:glycosyltransferase involved in cell wall biosynthesis